MSRFSRTDRSFLGRWWWTVDRGLLAAFLALAVLGVILVASASPAVAERIGLEPYHFLKRHLVMLLPALLLMLGVSMLEPRQLWRLASLLFVASLCAMVAVLFTGMEIKGAQRWLHVAGLSIQPSEFAKPAFAICAAWFMALQKKRENFPGNRVAAGLYLAYISLLLLQPDLGMTVIVTSLWAAQIFLAGFPFRLLIIFVAVAAIGLGTAYLAFDHVHSRINRFLDPESGDNYQVERSLEAFQNGGMFGTGPGQGTVKLTIPDAHADFIFAVGAEELGFIFTAVLMALYGFIVVRGFRRGMQSDDIFPVLAVGGLLTMLGLQATVHMGSALNVLPAKGMTLPFISYGGSSILSVGFTAGAILCLTRWQGRASIARGGLSLRPAQAEAKNTV